MLSFFLNTILHVVILIFVVSNYLFENMQTYADGKNDFMTKPNTEGSPDFVISKIEIPNFSE